MKTEFLARLIQQRSQTRLIRFDEQSVPGSTLSDLSPKLWEKFKSPLTNFSDEEFLLKLKLVTKDEENNIVPTVSESLKLLGKKTEYKLLDDSELMLTIFAANNN